MPSANKIARDQELAIYGEAMSAARRLEVGQIASLEQASHAFTHMRQALELLVALVGEEHRKNAIEEALLKDAGAFLEKMQVLDFDSIPEDRVEKARKFVSQVNGEDLRKEHPAAGEVYTYIDAVVRYNQIRRDHGNKEE